METMNGESFTINLAGTRSSEHPQESEEQATIQQSTEVPLSDNTNNIVAGISESPLGGSEDAAVGEILHECEQRPDEGRSSPRSPSVREIHKNSWLKKMPSVDRRPGRFAKTPRPEKFWVVFCVHDDKEAFLEFYENRRSAYSHKPLSSASLSYCLHISPTLFVQESDHEFVITLSTEVIRLAASTREQMLEWMDTMRTKLRDLGVLDPKDNVYTKEPRTPCTPLTQRDSSNLPQISSGEDSTSSLDHNSPQSEIGRYSSRDPNSPLPPLPPPPGLGGSNSHDVPSATVMYVRNPPPISPAPKSSNALTHGLQENVAVKSVESRRVAQCSSNVFNFDFVTSTLHDTSMSRENEDRLSGIAPSSVPQTSSSGFNTPVVEEPSIYEPLFYTASVSGKEMVLRGIGNPSYKNPRPQRRSESEADRCASGRGAGEQRRLSSSIASEVNNFESRPSSSISIGGLSQGLRNSSTSEPSLSGPSAACGYVASRKVSSSLSDQLSSSQSTSNNPQSSPSFTHVKQESSHNSVVRAIPLPLDEGPPPYDSVSHQSPHHHSSQVSNSAGDSPVPTDDMVRPLSLKEAQVSKLQKEIAHKSGVRLMLRKKDCVCAIAMVECFGVVWIAGWKQKEHPLLHNTFHIGDYIISIAGQRVHSVQDALKAIKNQPLIIEFVVRRVPHGKVFAIKRDIEGQSLGIAREGGTAEIKEVRQDGLAAKHGLPLKAPSVDGNSLCNWALTEINHRPLNLFFKDTEIQDRLNAVGRDISILVQPSDLVKALKKQLKTLRGYKDYIVQ